MKWVLISDRLPTEEETIDGRVPAIDSDGYLVMVMMAGDSLMGSELPIIYWLPVKEP